MSKLPIVAIVGRMNVGKSTLFNRLSKSVKSITFEFAGVTRDILKDVVSWNNRSFDLIDTGGISFRKTQDPLQEKVREKAIQTLQQADVVMFVCDGIIGVAQEDREIAKSLHKLGKNVILIVNKSDNHRSREHEHEFAQLGFKNTLHISAQHGVGIGELLDELVAQLPAHGNNADAEKPSYRVMLMGKPNVGKSSLMNYLTKQERSIVSDIPGTTREAIAEKINFYQEQIEIVDTPGIRRKRVVDEELETLMVKSALQAVRNADIVLLMIDSSEGDLVDQELKLGFYAFGDMYKALILLVNKEDLETDETRKSLDTELEIYQHFIKKIPVMHISCKSGKNVGKVMAMIDKVWEKYKLQIPDEEINFLFISNMQKKPLMHNGERLHIHRAYQIGNAPMRIVIEVNQPDWFGESQLKFLENLLRASYDLIGVPVKFIVKKQ